MGPQGPAGTGEDKTTFPNHHSWQFSDRGRRPVRDAHVTAKSVIIVQYVGHRASRPITVRQVRDGHFLAIGSPRRHFKYVVFN